MGEIKERTKWGERTITYKGITKRISEWAKELNISRTTLATRLEGGWPHEEIIEKPIRKIAPRVKKEEPPVIVLNASVKT